jgi:hypothetical protein
MDIFIVAGTMREPTEFANDMEFKGQTSIKITSRAFPALTSFTAAVKVNGNEYNGNVFHQSVLRAWFTKSSQSAAELYEYMDEDF